MVIYHLLWLEITGEEVKSLADAKAGDVVCYDGHVALYDGNGKIVEALNEDQGIVDTRKVDSDTILTIRRFTSNDEIGDTNAEKIWNYLRMHGFSKERNRRYYGQHCK